MSVRTLHHYHDVGLLVLAHIGENRHRYYGEADMLRLQQIPFYREFDMKLEDIARILDAPDFDCLAVLQEHKALLNAKGARIRILLRTIDLTIDGIKGDTKMNVKDLHAGFSADEKILADIEGHLVNHMLTGTAADSVDLDDLLTRHRTWISDMWGMPCRLRLIRAWLSFMPVLRIFGRGTKRWPQVSPTIFAPQCAPTAPVYPKKAVIQG